ncbi:hypothetical protein PIROE2DRAFT_3955 [Piromyces sp. E2]|nr:hypothetical protein PIROE2DRAFT_3955 [Piromyces sp. E2]|eukprot:OUM68357.1 hypothetical protein PIROE2DRAFT_3955 [Piromyces sp. E2]
MKEDIPFNFPEASEIKLITTDLDGTLLNSRRRISERTSIVVRRILEKYPKLHFVLASGRAKPATKLIREKLGIKDRPNTESLLCNGCLVYDSKGNIIWQNVIPKGFMLEVQKMICENALPEHVAIYSTGDLTVLFDEQWLNFAIEKCDEDAIVEDKEVFLRKIESGEAKVNKIGFMVFEPSAAEGK